MTQRRDLQALIDAAPVGKMQWRVIICCFLVVMLDGFDTAAIGFIAPDIRTHWQLTAGDLAPLFGAGLLGLTAGALLCGPLSDRFGRKRVIELCVFLFGALSLASAFSPDLQTLVFLRFLTGLGLGGAMPNTITMTSEYLPARRRGALVTLMFCGFTLGSAFGGIVSAQLVPVIGWHGILVLGGRVTADAVCRTAGSSAGIATLAGAPPATAGGDCENRQRHHPRALCRYPLLSH